MERRNAKGVLRPSISRGFSLTELLVSIAVLGILLVISVPTLLRAYRSYQLNDAASRFSGMLKATRFSAIRLNSQFLYCQVQQNGAYWTVWADLDGDLNPGQTEPQIVFGDTISMLGSGSVPPPTAILAAIGYTNSSLNVLSPGNVAVGFDQRGAQYFLPPAPVKVGVFYLGNTSVTDLGYRAIVLLPAGTVQVWSAGPGGPWVRIS